MIARLAIGLVFISTVLIARPAMAQSPYFDEYIDHAKFVQLSPQDQRDFLVALMQTVADLEQKAILSGRHLEPAEAKKTVHQLRWEQVKKALVSFQQLVVVAEAQADTVPPYGETCHRPDQITAEAVMTGDAFSPVPSTCMFGSYRSTYVRSNGEDYCQRPGCSINEVIRSEYSKVAQQANCNRNQMACNPALFGRNTQDNKPTCVLIDVFHEGRLVNTVQNASLACLIAVTNDANKDERLSKIATEIKNNRTTAMEFNKLLHTVSNLCICDGEVGMDDEVPDYLKDMSNDYSKYVKDHRTCNALLSQTSLVLKKINEQGGGRCAPALLPQNVNRLSEDLTYINNFSSHFHKLARGNGAADSRLTVPQIHSAMARYSARWVDATSPVIGNGAIRVAADEALDNVAEYISRRDELKARDNNSANSWCPLRFPDPEVPVLADCSISATSATRGEGGKVTVNATATPPGLPGGVTVQSISWKANGVEVAGQTAATLAAQNLEGIAANATSVPVMATYTLSNGTKKDCSGVASFPANNVPCEIKESAPVYDGANAKITFTVEKNAAMIPADSAMTVLNGEAPVTAGASGSFEITVPRSQGTVVLSASAASAPGGPALKCEKTVTLTQPQRAQTACTLTIGDTTEEAGKLKALVSLPESITDVTTVVWTPVAPTGTATSAKSATLTFDKPAASATQEIVATAVVTTPAGPVNCRGTKTITAPAVVAESTEGCTLSVGVVAGEEGKYSVSATITSATGPKAPKADTPPRYAGLSFSVANNIGMAVVDAGRELQTKEITATYTDKDNKNYSCKANAIIPAKAPAAGGGGFAPPATNTVVIPPVGGAVFRPGLR